MIVVHVILILIALLPYSVRGHGRLMDPPSRSSMWRLGFETPANYNDNELFCGGFGVQWEMNKGKCGICGDPYNSPQPRENEAGGKYGKGIISRSYKANSIIKVRVELSTNHKGWFEFRLCPNNNIRLDPGQDCLDKYLLQLADGSGTRYYIPDSFPSSGTILLKLKLPRNLICSQCVFQWHYYAGNNWGVCSNGVGSLGCGRQETYRGCADIQITKGNF